jgi:tetratricopeptide (TPR) repeat protein
VPPRRERIAWGVAGSITLVTVALVALQMGRGRLPAPAAPAMGTVGNAGPGRPPDISQMSPRERFDRLFERVMGAAERGSTDTVARFAPMALSAYSQLADADADARYHAAMIRLAVGDLAEAKALADTILAAQPGHLFGYLIRGEVAEAENDATALARSYEDFLKAYDARDGATSGRPEYDDHRPALEDFRTRAAGRGGR